MEKKKEKKMVKIRKNREKKNKWEQKIERIKDK